MNTLADRIKAINKELTALKTAHKRGLGNLRIYSKKVEIDPTGHEAPRFWGFEVTIDFDNKFASYPFAYMLPTMSDSGATSVTQQRAFTYTNNGFTIRFKAIYYFSSVDSSSFTIISTSPVTSVSYRWT